MELRRALNVIWEFSKQGLDAEGVTELRRYLEGPLVQTAEQQAEEERKRKARENRAGIADLTRAFATAR